MKERYWAMYHKIVCIIRSYGDSDAGASEVSCPPVAARKRTSSGEPSRIMGNPDHGRDWATLRDWPTWQRPVIETAFRKHGPRPAGAESYPTRARESSSPPFSLRKCRLRYQAAYTG